MLIKVFAVYDIKAVAYSNPIFVNTVGEALRSFQTACNDSSTMLNKYPEDYVLNELGTFDNCTGLFTSLERPTPLAPATDYVKRPE